MVLTPYADTIGQLLLSAPTDVKFSERLLVQPDLLVMPRLSGRIPRTFTEIGRLTLAVEILSPSTRRAAWIVKRALFQSEKLPEYWIIDPATRTVARWRPESVEAEVIRES